jgi:hypothetical protein
MLKPISFPFSVKENGWTGFVTTRSFCWANADPARKQPNAMAMRTERRLLFIPEG